MTTRETLEKDFDDIFNARNYEYFDIRLDCDLRKHIFEQMIPKVLEEILPKELDDEDNYYYRRVVNTTINSIKQKAKEKFNIDL